VQGEFDGGGLTMPERGGETGARGGEPSDRAVGRGGVAGE
jgi:hypothetical protein